MWQMEHHHSLLMLACVPLGSVVLTVFMYLLLVDAFFGKMPAQDIYPLKIVDASTAVGWLGLLVYLEMSPLSAVVWECCRLCTVLLSWVSRRVWGGDLACVTRPLGTELPVFSPSSSKVADLPRGFPHWVDSVYSKRNNVLFFIFINCCLY